MQLVPLAFNHAGITVPDIFAAVAWHCDVLGFTPIRGLRLLESSSTATHETPSVFGPRFRRAYQAHLLTGNGVRLELLQFVEPSVAEHGPEMSYWRLGPFHLCFTHPDSVAVVERICDGGGRRRAPDLSFVPGRPWRLAFREDPWSTVIKIISHSYAEIFGNWPQPGMTEPPFIVERPRAGAA